MHKLLHIGKFLAASISPAAVDRECLGLTLSSGSTATYFKIMPRFKNRSEGGPLMNGDDVMFCSMAENSQGYYLHETKSALGPLKSKFDYLYNEANLSRYYLA